jgi:hypothetical protein
MEKLAESPSAVQPAGAEKPSDAANMLPASLRAVAAVPYSHILGETVHSISIMRIRIKPYEMSSRFRHEMNAQARREPEDINEMPL